MATAGSTEANNDNWQYNRSVTERNKYMLEHQLATDVVFVVGNDQHSRKERISAHKYMLISGSPVFWSMFQGELRETGEIVVPDVTPQAFKEMLKFLYYEETNITGELVMEILYTSKKYLIPALTQTCTSYLEHQLSAQDACVILEQSLLFEEKALANKCLVIIQQETPNILRSNGFKKITRDTLMMILDDDELNIEESEVVLACIEWATTQIQNKKPGSQNFDGQALREQLGPALYKIRFTQMNIQQFGDVAVKSGILNKDEENLCFRYLSQSSKPTDIPFPTKPRTGSKELCLLPMSSVTKRLAYYMPGQISLQINNTCGKVLNIKGFGFQGICQPARLLMSSDSSRQPIQVMRAGRGRGGGRGYPRGGGRGYPTANLYGVSRWQEMNFTTEHRDNNTLILLGVITTVNPNQSVGFQINFTNQFQTNILDTGSITFTHGQLTLQVTSNDGNGLPFNRIYVQKVEEDNFDTRTQ